MWPDLKVGAKTAEVGNWQRFLTEQRCFDALDKPLVDDEAFGPKTLQATIRWQKQNRLTPLGGPGHLVVDREDRLVAQSQGFIPFIQAKNFGPQLHPNRSRRIDVITMHTMQNGEKPDSAENVGLWFAGKTRYAPPKASAHYGFDTDSVVQYVRDWDVAWHAAGCNHNGIGLEHAGRAQQGAVDWADETSLKILDLSAIVAAKLVKRYNIPIVKLTPLELKNGGRGFCGHADASIAFPGPGRDHFDPGEGFVWSHYLDLVRTLSA